MTNFTMQRSLSSAAWIWSRIRRLASSRDGLFREFLGYLEGGTDVFIETLTQAVEAAGGIIHCDAPADEILLEPGDPVVASGVRTGGTEVPSPSGPIDHPTPDPCRDRAQSSRGLSAGCHGPRITVKAMAAVSPRFDPLLVVDYRVFRAPYAQPVSAKTSLEGFWYSRLAEDAYSGE